MSSLIVLLNSPEDLALSKTHRKVGTGTLRLRLTSESDLTSDQIIWKLAQNAWMIPHIFVDASGGVGSGDGSGAGSGDELHQLSMIQQQLSAVDTFDADGTISIMSGQLHALSTPWDIVCYRSETWNYLTYKELQLMTQVARPVPQKCPTVNGTDYYSSDGIIFYLTLEDAAAKQNQVHYRVFSLLNQRNREIVEEFRMYAITKCLKHQLGGTQNPSAGVVAHKATP